MVVLYSSYPYILPADPFTEVALVEAALRIIPSRPVLVTVAVGTGVTSRLEPVAWETVSGLVREGWSVAIITLIVLADLFPELVSKVVGKLVAEIALVVPGVVWSIPTLPIRFEPALRTMLDLISVSMVVREASSAAPVGRGRLEADIGWVKYIFKGRAHRDVVKGVTVADPRIAEVSLSWTLVLPFRRRRNCWFVEATRV